MFIYVCALFVCVCMCVCSQDPVGISVHCRAHACGHTGACMNTCTWTASNRLSRPELFQMAGQWLQDEKQGPWLLVLAVVLLVGSMDGICNIGAGNQAGPTRPDLHSHSRLLRINFGHTTPCPNRNTAPERSLSRLKVVDVGCIPVTSSCRYPP